MPRKHKSRRLTGGAELVLNEYITVTPTLKQLALLMSDALDVFYGGAGGGGKSAGLLLAALLYVNRPGYDALILRTTLAELELPGGLISLSKEWLAGTRASYSEKKHQWTFPTSDPDRPATLTFGYLETDKDLQRYKGARFDFIGIDEASSFTEYQLSFMFSRLRRAKGSTIPPRFRTASNPGGPGHTWLKARYIDKDNRGKRLYIAAKLEDNPHLDREQYEESLAELDPITRRQIMNADWDAVMGGSMFKPKEWLGQEGRILRELPPTVRRLVRYWDLAATKDKAGTDPDYTVGALMGLDSVEKGRVYLVDVLRRRDTPGAIKALMSATGDGDMAEFPGRAYEIAWEEEGGGGGKFSSEDIKAVLKRFALFADHKQSGESKRARAGPVASAMESGNLVVVARESRSQWLGPWLDELEVFPNPKAHDDQVDATSGAYARLTNRPGRGIMDYYAGLAKAAKEKAQDRSALLRAAGLTR